MFTCKEVNFREIAEVKISDDFVVEILFDSNNCIEYWLTRKEYSIKVFIIGLEYENLKINRDYLLNEVNLLLNSKILNCDFFNDLLDENEELKFTENEIEIIQN